MKYFIIATLVFCQEIFLIDSTRAQEDQTTAKYHFNGQVSVTNNGFSFVPTFSLGKPALITDLSVGGRKFSFDPQFRFDLEGLQGWSFIFIWRYKLINTDKQLLRLGVHLPAYSFRSRKVIVDGVETEEIYTQRWFTPELTYSYHLSKSISAGIYYIHGFGLEPVGQTKHTDFASLQLGFNDIKISKSLLLKWHPQFYFLNMDGLGGYFTAQSVTLAHRDFPVSVSAMMNKSLGANNEIPSKSFDWNISLVYSFKNELSLK